VANRYADKNSFDLFSIIDVFSNWSDPDDNFGDSSGSRPLNSLSNAVSMMEADRVRNFRHLLEYRPYIDEKSAQFTPGQIFLVGGLDLTPHVAERIFSKYRIPERLKAAYILIIKDYTDFEKSGNVDSQW